MSKRLSPYFRFWWRTCVVFCPLTFLILYGSGVIWWKALLSGLGVGVGGLVLVLPFILSWGNVDRSLWSQEEHMKRQIRYREKLRQWENQEEDDR
ncbi:hypothetical protein [Tumebacillus flagellatus]|uniref:hypothetical protein n=1 Tax=Tumebacillus flagellatus TaxID=1157490 RepID=UPI0012690A7C|nr:hypothetical protein [Tumebacillus flagellatus]